MKRILSGKNLFLILLLVICISFISISLFLRNKQDDFNFRLNYSVLGREQIDTYNNTFTKDLVINGTKTIQFKIPVEVKNKIYSLMREIDIMSFPDTLENAGISVSPSSDYKLTVLIDGKTKTIIWKEGLYPEMTNNLPRNNREFLKLVKYIQDYIYSTKEYKSMPEANGGYA